jgi:hypothetical protein
MELSKSIDVHVRDYPLWSLILGSVGTGLLAVGHIIRYKQSAKAVHNFLASGLICLSIQYICATLDIYTAFFNVIADSSAIFANISLLFIWKNSMKSILVDACQVSCLLLLIPFYSLT